MSKSEFLYNIEQELNNAGKRDKRKKILSDAIESAPNENDRQVLLIWEILEYFPKETRGNKKGKKLDYLSEQIVVAEAFELFSSNPEKFSPRKKGALVSDELVNELAFLIEEKEIQLYQGMTITVSTVKRLLQKYSERTIKHGYPAPFTKKPL